MNTAEYDQTKCDTQAPGDLQDRIVESIEDGICFVGLDGRVRVWTAGAPRITGYAADEMIGRGCPESSINHVGPEGETTCDLACPFAATMRDGLRRQALRTLRHRDGHGVPVRLRTTAARDSTGAVIGATGVFTDETPVGSTQVDIEELRRLAFADHLTGIPNRTHAERTLAARLASLARHGWPFGLLVVDMDGLKLTNDHHGHLAGDEVLRAVARTLTGACRADDVVARWGGDEFVVIVAAVGRDALMATARRIRRLVSQTRVYVDDDRLGVSVSIGGTTGQARDTIETLFARADRALYEAKQAGRDVVRLLDPEDDREAIAS